MCIIDQLSPTVKSFINSGSTLLIQNTCFLWSYTHIQKQPYSCYMTVKNICMNIFHRHNYLFSNLKTQKRTLGPVHVRNYGRQRLKIFTCLRLELNSHQTTRIKTTDWLSNPCLLGQTLSELSEKSFLQISNSHSKY